MVSEILIAVGASIVLPYFIKRFAFGHLKDEDTFQEVAPHEVIFKKICLNAKLCVTAIPGKQEAYFVTYHPGDGTAFLLFHDNPFIKGMIKYNSRVDIRMLSLKNEDTIDVLLHQNYGSDFLFKSLNTVFTWVTDNFYGYLNYSKATDILTDKLSDEDKPEEAPYTETELISKMIEAEKNGDKELEHKLLDLWEKHFQNKKNK